MMIEPMTLFVLFVLTPQMESLLSTPD
jgi:hypothetical protein